MNDITALMARIPERKRHDWSQSVMHDCDFCHQWALTVKHEDGARICASCCDAEYTSKLEVANAALVEALEARDKQIARLEKKLSDRKRMNQEMATAMLKPVADEPRTVTVKLPAAWWVKQGPQELLAYEKQMLLDALAVAGIQVIEGEGQ